jgi:DNA-binding GntR family transcriptional regulator
MASPQPESRPLYELIYDVLREHLVEASLPAGLVFGETTVARAFGSSRIPAAAALQRLKSEGLLKNFDGRGLIAAAADPDELVRSELVAAGLRLPTEVTSGSGVRNHHSRIYPLVEHTIAASLSYGKFLVNESALAEHYGVSRTVAHEVLTRLERAGLIAQEGNQRWYAGPLTAESMRDHFEMRWLLEPVALGQSMDFLDPTLVSARREHLAAAMTQKLTPLRREKLETELHVHTVLARANAQMVETIRRSQLLVIPTHSTFASQPYAEELGRSSAEHLEIYDLIAAGKKKPAMRALEQHVRGALGRNVERLQALRPLSDAKRPPFLIPADKGD